MRKSNLILAVLMAVMVQVSTAQVQLYGTCYYGGTANRGTLFSFDGNGNNLHVEYNFPCDTNGAYPLGNLLLAGNGKIYGVTYDENGFDSSICYSFNLTTGDFNIIHKFYNDSGGLRNTFNGLHLANDGYLYGLASSCPNPIGIIYKVDPSTDNYIKTFGFSIGNPSPYGILAQANDGKIYGTQNGGGIFSYNLNDSTSSQLYSFNNLTGYSDHGGLIYASDGKLYGMTSGGGADSEGVIFSFDISSNTYTDLHDFNLYSSHDGAMPEGNLIQASDGKLYGMTYMGGASVDYGIIFSYDITTNVFTDLVDFDGTNGGTPTRGLIQASDGKLYGVTQEGGIYGRGNVFSYDITTNIYTKLIDFNEFDSAGYFPDCYLVEVPRSSGIPTITNKEIITVYPNPATTLLNIHQSTPSPSARAEQQLIITDLLGTEVYKETLTGIDNTISISTWSTGIYFYEVRSTTDVARGKFVKGN